MTNAEFYRHEIEREHENFCGSFLIPKILAPKNQKCIIYDCVCEDDIRMECKRCQLVQAAWLQEEHKEPSVDWENVPMDTPILVRYGDGKWAKRHFAGVKDDGVLAWSNGRTSHTETNTTLWVHAKLWEGSEEQAAEQEAKG